MPKLVKNADGSISFEYDDKVPEELAKKQLLQRHKEIEGQTRGKDFKSLTPADKDNLLELLLREHNLI